MKTALFFSALMTLIAVGCGEAPEAAEGSSLLARPDTAPLSCTFQTSNGRFLTAVGGGGRTTDVLHTDATTASTWETFKLIDSGDGQSPINYGIMTKSGHYLTAVGGGGRITDVIHSNATNLQGWEKFALNSLGGGIYTITTATGNYVTANNGGGLIRDTIHTDATRAGAWEKFRVSCRHL